MDHKLGSLRVLNITYCSPDKDGETHHATIPFPQNYEQAVYAALRLLGRYMADPKPKADGVVLKHSHRHLWNDKWIWADFDPEDWLFVVHPYSEIGIFLKQVSTPLATQAVFLCGPVHLVFGQKRRGLTTWTVFLLF
ncbi:hypothetical protein C8R47DRAFT_1095320 [Mycena vitilis]|nr:hypothetical protein C8R47DRAFT_1095320 [Mycena vitilis]